MRRLNAYDAKCFKPSLNLLPICSLLTKRLNSVLLKNVLSVWNWGNLPQGTSNAELWRGRLKLVLQSAPFGSLSNDDDKENGKKNKTAKQQLCTCITLFCAFLYRRCTTTKWNFLISRFSRMWTEDNNFLFFSFSKVRYRLLELNSRNIRWHLWNERDETRAM